jgi:hypothetical protein
MPLQNRVTPAGAIIATSARGTLMGNRGILHDENKRIVRTSRNIMWLICRLEFKGRRRAVMAPGRYTELFFLDEAVALAAGHRPCGECRRPQYRSYMAAVNEGSEHLLTGPRDLDQRLNESRRAPRFSAPLASLPDGVFVALRDEFRLVWEGSLYRWMPSGYVDAIPITDVNTSDVEVVTPALSVAALRRGYRPQVHPSAESTGEPAEEIPMTSLTPELLDEIKRHLRANPMRHGAVFRAMEQNLSLDQMGTSRSNARNFLNSVEAMLTGTLPTAMSAAQTNAYGYQYLLGCDLSPELRSYTQAFLRRLREINPNINVDKPLQLRALPVAAQERKPAHESTSRTCPNCHLSHSGGCDF